MEFTRRAWFKRILGAGLALRYAFAGAEQRLAVDRLVAECGVPFTTFHKRTYRADVVVTLLGIPIFSRESVGSAMAGVREGAQGNRKIVGLEFGGAANAARTHGIHYFGCTEEAILEAPSEPMEAACFGFVTARGTNQESLDQARQYLRAGAPRPATVSVVEQTARDNMLEKHSAMFPANDLAGRDLPEICKQVRFEFQRADSFKREFGPAGKAQPFLFSVLRAVRGFGKGSAPFFHNGSAFRLDYEKAPDPHAGAFFAAKKLTACPHYVLRLTGQIHDPAKGHSSTFKLWLDNSSELPIRIEFSPRSYLRIALELDPAPQPSANSKEEA